jgi:hypothetical protein
MKTLLFANEQLIMADSKDRLQILIHKLETVIYKHGPKISTRKMKTMAFNGREKRSSEKQNCNT